MFQDANPPFLFSLPNMHAPFCYPSTTRSFVFTTAVATLDNGLCRNAACTVASPARRSNSVQNPPTFEEGRTGRKSAVPLTRMEFSGWVGQEHQLQSIDIDPPRGELHPLSSVITPSEDAGIWMSYSAILAALTLARGGYGTPSCRLEDRRRRFFMFLERIFFTLRTQGLDQSMVFPMRLVLRSKVQDQRRR